VNGTLQRGGLKNAALGAFDDYFGHHVAQRVVTLRQAEIEADVLKGLSNALDLLGIERCTLQESVYGHHALLLLPRRRERNRVSQPPTPKGFVIVFSVGDEVVCASIRRIASELIKT
jgi:hypothetical protein